RARPPGGHARPGRLQAAHPARARADDRGGEGPGGPLDHRGHRRAGPHARPRRRVSLRPGHPAHPGQAPAEADGDRHRAAPAGGSSLRSERGRGRGHRAGSFPRAERPGPGRAAAGLCPQGPGHPAGSSEGRPVSGAREGVDSARRFVPLSALLSLALAATGPQHAFEDWARERARAFEQGDRSTSSKAPIWRERNGSGPFLVGFSAPSSLAPLIRAVSPGVINVLTYSEPGEGIAPGPVPTATGSGVLAGPEGYVVRNPHVVKDAQWIQVRLADGRVFDAELVGSDPDTDLALLRVVDGTDLPSVVLGDSDRLEVGDWVVAIGNPFGLDRSVSHGLISAKERVLGVGPLDDFIQTDALINPGNSGGPLFNMRGEVVGVNSAVISNAQGIGFAVPINMVKDLIPNLLDNGHVERG